MPGAPLTHEEHLELLTCITELHRCRSLEAFPRRALDALAPLIPSNLSAFNEVNMPRGRIVAITDRVLENHEGLMVEWERYSPQHPLVRYVVETGDGQAIKFSDFLSEDEYHRLDLYRSFYRLLEAEDQICITVRSDEGVLIAIAFNRDRGFTENDRIKLNLVRPHLLQAYANLEELAGHREEKDDLQTALRETGHGLIALDARGRIGHATPGAAERLTHYFPGHDAAETLPAPIADWLSSGPDTPFTTTTSRSKLIIRSPRHTKRPLLLLSEEARRRLPGGERLTPRETEVLRWMAEGKSNGAIATILGVATGTVKQHVEHILAKLGVENRTAATARARELGLI